ncbi:hypothetical protein N7468_002668 [Penicillium chermesinum]|uniref:Aldehyde dehydrogenase domain-containing protein n=1 Tax=Penicillium chermesinum TaxID=63820 RepID=A0A9W9PJ02_9EURO|nr:uncharacterized protein N7468_002668 [Penicillium chermesinum]KAJ5247685.1 hypothetical protein N7468_002668 [Penicillium chermesinum]KAJ6151450.1 hypothetical protein N7470_007047 [Penicillium chermesinum]
MHRADLGCRESLDGAQNGLGCWVQDIDKVVQSAKKGFEAWKAVAELEKGRVIRKLDNLIERDVQDLTSIGQ